MGEHVQTSSNKEWDRVWIGANIASMVAGAEPYGKLESDALAVKGERIAWIGSADEGRRRAAALDIPVEDCRGLWMTPGLIDCHTHLVYGGNRVDEFEKRLCGVSYEDIARAGGGIQSTINATRAADAAELRAAAAVRAKRLMSEGVTTIEVKSGYGLDLAGERRLLEVARSLERDLAVSVRTTYLGLHALPQEYREDRQSYVDQASGPWLESLIGAGLVDAVDAFCENIAFSVAEAGQFLRAARHLGIPAHLHAGQLSDMGAAELAARYGALSADHLEYLERARRAGARRRGHGRRAAAVRLLHPAPDNAAAGPAAARGGRADGGGDRLQSGHLPVHIAAARAQHGLHPVRPDARRVARWRDPARRASAGAAGRDSARSRWASVRISPCGTFDGPPNCATPSVQIPASAWCIAAGPQQPAESIRADERGRPAWPCRRLSAAQLSASCGAT